MIIKNALAGLQGKNLTKRIDFAKYRKIMSYPVWNYIRQAIVSTRAYEEGLNAGLLLLDLTEEYRQQLDAKEYEKNLIMLYYHILDMLDRADRWEEYLNVWEQIRENTNFAMTYTLDSRFRHGERIAPFILRTGPDFLYVHFLYIGSHRKEVITRKLNKKKSGDKTKHLLHARQEDLSEAEIKRRLDWIIRIANSACRDSA
jgi:hypothetical protein